MTGFPTVVVRWIGARWDGTRALIRGVVDRNAQQVKDWLRSGAIDAPSSSRAAELRALLGGITDQRPQRLDVHVGDSLAAKLSTSSGSSATSSTPSSAKKMRVPRTGRD